MTEHIVLFTMGSLPITAYGLMIAVAVGAGLLCMRVQTRCIGLPGDTMIRFGLWAVSLGLVFGRGVFVALRWSLVVNVLGWRHVFMLWDGGFALFGVLAGCLFAAICCAKRMNVSVADVMDAAAPAGALTLALARFAEVFTPQGVGRSIAAPGLFWFPVAVQNYYGEWVTPVFFWEGIAALTIACLTVGALRRGKRRPFEATFLFLLWLGISQIFLESLRADDILRLGLVKMSQLTAMVCVLTAAVHWTAPVIRAKQMSGGIIACGTGLAAGVGICTGIEFALDKTPIPNSLLYLFMAFTLAGMAVMVYRLRKMAIRITGVQHHVSY